MGRKVYMDSEDCVKTRLTPLSAEYNYNRIFRECFLEKYCLQNTIIIEYSGKKF